MSNGEKILEANSVDLAWTLRRRRRSGDPADPWSVRLDAVVGGGALRTDRCAACELGEPVDPVFVREFVESTESERVPPAFPEAMIAGSRKVPARVWKGRSKASWKPSQRPGPRRSPRPRSSSGETATRCCLAATRRRSLAAITGSCPSGSRPMLSLWQRECAPTGTDALTETDLGPVGPLPIPRSTPLAREEAAEAAASRARRGLTSPPRALRASRRRVDPRPLGTSFDRLRTRAWALASLRRSGSQCLVGQGARCSSGAGASAEPVETPACQEGSGHLAPRRVSAAARIRPARRLMAELGDARLRARKEERAAGAGARCRRARVHGWE
jgi:hypothetical protein